jgi:hypothetical protein
MAIVKSDNINLTSHIINAEFRIYVLERIIERLVQVTNPDALTAQDLKNIRREAFDIIKKKYPNLGIDFEID